MVVVDVGIYLFKCGVFVLEIVVVSWSQYKSQGFGSSGMCGSLEEYLELVKGIMFKNVIDFFEGINIIWICVVGGEFIGKVVV